jgi:hypothetical protein
MGKKFTILCAFAFFVLIVGWAITPALAHVGPDGECLHNRPDHPHCAVGGSARMFIDNETPGFQIRHDDGGVVVNPPPPDLSNLGCGTDSLPVLDENNNPSWPFDADWPYWHSAPGAGNTADLPCDDGSTFGEPSHRVLSALLACGWCFNTFGADKPLDDNIWHHINRWVVFNFSGCAGCPNIDQEIEAQVANDPNWTQDLADAIPPVHAADGFDNLEVRFDINPAPFEGDFSGGQNFEIEIMGPRTRKNGRIVWDTKYTLVYSSALTMNAPQEHVVVISTINSGAAVLTRLSDGETWNVNMPFSITGRRVFGGGEENPPTN